MEPADLVQKTIGISEQILSDFEKSYQAVIAKVVASSISYTSSQTEEGSEIEEPQVISVVGRRERQRLLLVRRIRRIDYCSGNFARASYCKIKTH